MRLVPLTQLSPGARLAQSIYGTTGRPLLCAGVEINREYLDLLAERAVPAVWVEDPDTADISSRSAISPELRETVTARLGESFNNMAERTEGLRESYVAVARREMSEARFADAIRSAVGDGGLHQIANDMDRMLDELKGQQVVAGLNSIKSHDAYTFQHSIDVTIMGLVLARSMSWDRLRLRAFGVGCMLHDIGKLFIAPELLNKRSRLTEDEYEQMKAHPGVGYRALKAVAEHVGVLAAHVAYQHHEKQDGTGYPRKLRGTNALGGKNEPGTIHDFGAIAAVADVYDAMTSCRPYREGWSPARTLAMIQEGAGTHFNRQAVRILAETVPPYPALSDVRVRTGRHAGWSGVVAEVHRFDLARPTVRLMFRPDGVRVEPVELDLRVDADVAIEPGQTTLAQPKAAAA